MPKDPLDELVQFLKPESRVDLKHVALEHLVGLSASEEGLKTLLKNNEVVQHIIDLTDDKYELVAKNALLILLNISSSPTGASELIKYRTKTSKNIVEELIGYVLNPEKKDADAAGMILSNITRNENELELCVDMFLPHFNNIINALIDVEYNKKDSTLDYVMPVLSNLTCSHRIRKALLEAKPYIPLIKLLPFCNYERSSIRRLGALCTIKNLSFDTELHDFLLGTELDLLTYLLNPLIGNEEYPDDEMDKLPIALQYLPNEKQREPNVDIRKMVLETLNKFCTKRHGREVLRSNGVYYVLREYHKWERDASALLACENVVDILIQKEDEVGADDLSTVNVPEEMHEKFVKMDEDYIKDVENTHV